jgi:hypothetical protein
VCSSRRSPYYIWIGLQPQQWEIHLTPHATHPQLPRTRLPRTPVNEGIRKGRGCYYAPALDNSLLRPPTCRGLAPPPKRSRCDGALSSIRSLRDGRYSSRASLFVMSPTLPWPCSVPKVYAASSLMGTTTISSSATCPPENACADGPHPLLPLGASPFAVAGGAQLHPALFVHERRAL